MQEDLARLHRDVVFGRSGGKIIWQPRIGCWYDDKQFAGEPLPEPYDGMSVPEIHRELGCSARLYREYNPCFVRVEDPDVTFREERLSSTDVKTTIRTPVGEQVEVLRASPNNWAKIHVKWQVESQDELKVAAWRERHTTWIWDQECFDAAQRDVGDLGAPTIFMPRMNVQSLYIERMGVANAMYALHDWPRTVEDYFDALEESHSRLIKVINASPVDIINFGENIHATTLTPDLFERYHLPACRRRCEALHRAGKFVCSHWDGDCGPLLRFAQETGLDGIEAITPSPQGDVELREVRLAFGDEMYLIDGIPAIYFDDTFPVETLVECTQRLIDLFAPKLVLGISDEISSTGDIERVRVVGQIVDEYNQSVAV